ncbi:MAG: DUF58 domain-containing protein [Porcipelethomonas sp.]
MAVLIIITGVILLILTEAKIYKSRGFSGIEYSCQFEKSEVFEGETVEFTEILTNTKKLPMPNFKSELTVSAALEFSETQVTKTGDSAFVSSFFSLRGKSSITRKWKVKCTQPGVFSIENITLVASDPLDLLSVSQKAECRFPEITVLPERYIFEADIRGKAYENDDSPAKNTVISDPFHTNGIYEYDGSQPVRSINWSQSAKLDNIMTNRYDCLSEKGFSVIADCESFSSKKELLHGLRVTAQTLYLLSDSSAELVLPCRYEDSLLYTGPSRGLSFQKECRRMLARVPSSEAVPPAEVQTVISPGFMRVIVTADADRLPEDILKENHIIIAVSGGTCRSDRSVCITVREDENGKTAP